MFRFANLAFLLVLGASAGVLPQQLGRFLKPPPKPESKEEVRFEEVERLLDLAAQRHAGLDQAEAAGLEPSAKQVLAELTPQVELIRNPVMEALLKASRPKDAGSTLQLAHTAVMVHRIYEENQAWVMGLVWGLPAALLGLSLAGLLAGAKGLSRTLADTCGSLARKWMFLLSLAAAAAFLGMRVDLWSACPPDLWGVPVGAMLISSFLLRAVDLNVPVWNSLISGLMAPLISCGVILGWDFVSGLARGILS